MIRINRRTLLKASAAFAGASALGFPSIVSGQTEKIKIGHLTPLTGFLGALGAYAVLGMRMAEAEINASGGVMGRQIEVMSEDSVNPATAATKAQRMLEQDGVAVLMGEINSASALTIMQVAARNKKLFMQIGARSDALRGKNCNKYTFHVDIPNTVMVNAVGKALLRDNMVKDKKFFTLTADYIFGHDSAGRGQALLRRQSGQADRRRTDRDRRHRLQPLSAQDPAGQARRGLLEPRRQSGHQPDQAIRRIRPALSDRRLQPQHRRRLGGRRRQSERHLADGLVSHAGASGSKTFVENFTKRNGKPPENHAWIEYVSLKMMAQAMNETKSTDTDKLIAYFEKKAQFDILKGRKGYFRSWDHQLIQEGYPFTVRAKGQAKDKWDFLALGAAIPNANEPLEVINPTKEQNPCTFS